MNLKRLPSFILALLISLIVSPAIAQNCCDIDGDVDLCYLSGADFCASNAGSCNEYSLDGNWMVNALKAKLESPANYGANGVVECELTLKKLEDISSVQAINDCGCDIIFLPNVFVDPATNALNLDSSFIPTPILQNIYDWSVLCDNNLVIATQGEANLWGYKTENANVNPNTPIAGTSLNTIYDGPFGSLDFFNQGGSYQGVFTETPSTGHEVLAYDANQNPTVALDEATGDIVVGDIGIFCSGGAGVVTTGANVTNNNDILICNLFALACQLVEEVNTSFAVHEICPGESVLLPDGQVVTTAGTWVDTLISLNGCDSIVTTAVAYGIGPAPILEFDTLICKGETVTLDGTIPYDIPAPYFINETDIAIPPSGINITSPIDVSGFSNTVMGPGILKRVCIDVDHSWISDMDVLLLAPDGSFVDLTSDNGAGGDDYIGTCFTTTASTVISDVILGAPYTGDWLPEGQWSDLYGSPVNGTWQLVLRDDTQGINGTLLEWSIEFEPILEIFYNWETPVGLSCDDCPVTDATPAENTTYFLTLTDSYGCQIFDSVAIGVEDILPAPEVICDSVSLNSISVSWNPIVGAIGYQININGMGWVSPNNGLLGHFIGGLSTSDTILIEVQGLDDCKGEIDTVVCITPECTAPTPNLIAVSATSCYGSEDGGLTVTASGGTGIYIYDLNGLTNTSGVFDNLPAGTYEVLVEDDVFCENSIEVIIPEPDSMELMPIVVEDVSCFGFSDGSLTATVFSGTAPFDFSWNGLPGDSILSNAIANDYALLVTDANGCTATVDILLDEPTPLSATSNSTMVSCFDGNDGIGEIIPEGGVLPYTFLWDAAANAQVTPVATGLANGTYSVSVTDNNGCLLTPTIQINEPAQLIASILSENPNCSDTEDGTATVTAEGGTPGYNYQWSGSLPDAPNVSGLAAGTYLVTIGDQNGCTTTQQTALQAPEAIAIVLTQQTDASCFGGSDGSISVSTNGAIGTPVYSWDNGATTATNPNLNAGTYCLTISDDNGCEANDCYTIAQATAINLSASALDVSCDNPSGGAINLNVSGGTGPYTFNWSNGSTLEDPSGLTVGIYQVTVTDSQGCTAISGSEVNELLPLFSLQLNATKANCFGESTGAIDLDINGQGSGFEFLWTGPSGFQSTDEDIMNLPPGLYNVVVSDADGCTLSGEVEVNQPQVLFVDYYLEDVTCFGEEDGSIIIQPEGGATPYLFSFDGGANFTDEQIFEGLSGGTFELITQDANGCESNNTVTITEPQEIIITLEPQIEITLGESYQYDAGINIPDTRIDSINWFPIDSLTCLFCLAPIANPHLTTLYTLEVFTDDGCAALATSLLSVDRRIPVYIPNAFSPNGDDVNDVLMVFSGAVGVVEIVDFQIFGRWGEQVFRAQHFQPNEVAKGWDGRLKGEEMQPGVFAWIAVVELLDGEVVRLRGDVTLVK